MVNGITSLMGPVPQPPPLVRLLTSLAKVGLANVPCAGASSRNFVDVTILCGSVRRRRRVVALGVRLTPFGDAFGRLAMVGRLSGIFLCAFMQLGEAAVWERVVRVLVQGYVECSNCPVDLAHLSKRKPKMNVRLWPMV